MGPDAARAPGVPIEGGWNPDLGGVARARRAHDPEYSRGAVTPGKFSAARNPEFGTPRPADQLLGMQTRKGESRREPGLVGKLLEAGGKVVGGVAKTALGGGKEGLQEVKSGVKDGLEALAPGLTRDSQGSNAGRAGQSSKLNAAPSGPAKTGEDPPGQLLQSPEKPPQAGPISQLVETGAKVVGDVVKGGVEVAREGVDLVKGGVQTAREGARDVTRAFIDPPAQGLKRDGAPGLARKGGEPPGLAKKHGPHGDGPAEPARQGGEPGGQAKEHDGPAAPARQGSEPAGQARKHGLQGDGPGTLQQVPGQQARPTDGKPPESTSPGSAHAQGSKQPVNPGEALTTDDGHKKGPLGQLLETGARVVGDVVKGGVEVAREGVNLVKDGVQTAREGARDVTRALVDLPAQGAKRDGAPDLSKKGSQNEQSLRQTAGQTDGVREAKPAAHPNDQGFSESHAGRGATGAKIDGAGDNAGRSEPANPTTSGREGVVSGERGVPEAAGKAESGGADVRTDGPRPGLIAGKSDLEMGGADGRAGGPRPGESAFQSDPGGGESSARVGKKDGAHNETAGKSDSGQLETSSKAAGSDGAGPGKGGAGQSESGLGARTDALRGGKDDSFGAEVGPRPGETADMGDSGRGHSRVPVGKSNSGQVETGLQGARTDGSRPDEVTARSAPGQSEIGTPPAKTDGARADGATARGAPGQSEIGTPPAKTDGSRPDEVTARSAPGQSEIAPPPR